MFATSLQAQRIKVQLAKKIWCQTTSTFSEWSSVCSDWWWNWSIVRGLRFIAVVSALQTLVWLKMQSKFFLLSCCQYRQLLWAIYKIQRQWWLHSPSHIIKLINFKFDTYIPTRIKLFIYNYQGKLIDETIHSLSNNNNISFNSESISNGIYFYKLVSDFDSKEILGHGKIVVNH